MIKVNAEGSGGMDEKLHTACQTEVQLDGWQGPVDDDEERESESIHDLVEEGQNLVSEKCQDDHGDTHDEEKDQSVF
jgi:hypothetical protein